MTFRIEVTAEDIAAGVAEDSAECPVALAIRRTTGEAWQVDVDRLFDPLARVEFNAPRLVRSFVQAFDAGEEVAPFSFDLDPTDRVVFWDA